MIGVPRVSDRLLRAGAATTSPYSFGQWGGAVRPNPDPPLLRRTYAPNVNFLFTSVLEFTSHGADNGGIVRRMVTDCVMRPLGRSTYATADNDRLKKH